jgi:LysM repeat protein
VRVKNFIEDCYWNVAHIKRIWVGLGVALVVFLSVSTVSSFAQSPLERDFLLILEHAGQRSISTDPFLSVPRVEFDRTPLTFLEKNSLVAAVPPVLVSSQTLGYIREGEDHAHTEWVSEYIVQDGDTLSSIATKFHISLNTIFWANDLTKNSIIKPGKKLIILPVDGVIHHVKDGDTVGGLAQRYKTKSADIVQFNKLSSEGDIFIGDILVIPGGTPPPAASPSSPSQTAVATNYFMRPIQGGKVSQRLHWYNAIDFAAPCEITPILASAGGVVQRVSYGWNGGGGNNITILHPNGVVTYYGHILNQSAFVSPGQQVNQGERIALVGGQPGMAGAGISTGCHVHFGVHGAANPFRGLQIGQ